LFELTTAPRLNILTYRIVPPSLRRAWEAGSAREPHRITEELNRITTTVQRRQREAGRSFVSRTTIRRAGKDDVTVFRAVIMNPMTTPAILEEILDEQEGIYRATFEGEGGG
jgi:glutamate decarboxylase